MGVRDSSVVEKSLDPEVKRRGSAYCVTLGTSWLPFALGVICKMRGGTRDRFLIRLSRFSQWFESRHLPDRSQAPVRENNPTPSFRWPAAATKGRAPPGGHTPPLFSVEKLAKIPDSPRQ